MTKFELAAQLRNSMFADRATLAEAYEYARLVAQASDNPSAVYTAIHVMMNTISKELLALEVDN